ncbi:hypothetical protein ACA910_000964 [Epithemia clementina (nom. ined.)]
MASPFLVFASLMLATITWSPRFATGASYRPGLRPRTYSLGEEIPLRVDAVTSTKTQIPIDYYYLPFCQPEGGPSRERQSLGQFLEGSRIQSSPYHVYMKTETYCSKLCQVNYSRQQYERMRWHIERFYHHNWLLDHLPAASIESWPKQTEHFSNGFPIGFVVEPTNEESSKNAYYIFNHFNLVIDFERVVGTSDTISGYRVIEFAVQPLSIQHAFVGNYSWDGVEQQGYIKPLSTCPYKRHLSLDDVQVNQELVFNKPIIFTYDVVWRDSDKRWSQRWEIYLTHDNWVPVNLHWASVFNSFVVAFMLTGMLVAIWIRSMKSPSEARAMTIPSTFRSMWVSHRRYTSLSTEDTVRSATPTTHSSEQDLALQEQEQEEERNWRCLHADVFRPPATMPDLFCALIGTGVQLTVACFAVVVLASLGLVSQAVPGSVPNAFLVIFNLSGCVSGYVSYRLYSSFGAGTPQLQKCVGMVALIIPGCFFASFCFLNVCLYFRHSTASLPILDVLIVLSGWLCGLIPLVVFGAYVASLQELIEYPTHTNPVPREIPTPSSIWKRPFVALLIAGILPYGSVYVEVFSLMASLWYRQYYYVFRVALVVSTLALWTAGVTSILMVCVQLRLENHRWWWFSIMCGGSVAACIAIYGFWVFPMDLDPSFVTYMIYFLYMTWICFSIFLVFGAVGTLSCLFFLIKLYQRLDPELVDATETTGNENSGYIMLESIGASLGQDECTPSVPSAATETGQGCREGEQLEPSQETTLSPTDATAPLA